VESQATKSIAVATKRTAQTFQSAVSATVTNWFEETDTNGDFDPLTGIFTVPRDGNYSVSFSFNFVRSAIVAGSQVEAIISSTGSGSKKSIVTYPAGGTAEGGASISFVMKLVAGDEVWAGIYQSTGSDKTFRIYTSSDPSGGGFVNFSVAEL
jgi:hypothetical protein